jgi:hypothetical protein
LVAGATYSRSLDGVQFAVRDCSIDAAACSATQGESV